MHGGCIMAAFPEATTYAWLSDEREFPNRESRHQTEDNSRRHDVGRVFRFEPAFGQKNHQCKGESVKQTETCSQVLCLVNESAVVMLTRIPFTIAAKRISILYG